MNATFELTALEIIDDQDLMKDVPESERVQMGIEVLNSVAQFATDRLAHWLTMDEAQWPVSDGVDTWEYASAQQAWQDYLTQGASGTDWFRSTYYSEA